VRDAARMEMRHSGDVRGAAGVIMPRTADPARSNPLRNGLLALAVGLVLVALIEARRRVRLNEER
jgi:hypothetical protein